MTNGPRHSWLVFFAVALVVFTVAYFWIGALPEAEGTSATRRLATAMVVTEVFLGCLAMLVFALRGVYATFRAAANRYGVGWFEATNGLSLLFCLDNYTDDGKRWVRIYRRSFVGFLVAPVVMLLAMFATNAVCSSLGIALVSDDPPAAHEPPP